MRQRISSGFFCDFLGRRRFGKGLLCPNVFRQRLSELGKVRCCFAIVRVRVERARIPVACLGGIALFAGNVAKALEDPDLTAVLEEKYAGTIRPSQRHQPQLVVFATGSAVIASDERLVWIANGQSENLSAQT